tara:strand:- start:15 stop:230 length:216 start_codon:yes stop_codon:yes gene_type:complete
VKRLPHQTDEQWAARISGWRRIELSNRAIIALMRLEQARCLARELSALWHGNRVITYSIFSAAMWALFFIN